MIGERYSVTGIKIMYGYSGNNKNGWSASVDFFDAGFADDDAAEGSVSTGGVLQTRYYVANNNGSSGLEAAVRAILTDMERLGLKIPTEDDFYLYFHQGEHDMEDEIPAEEIEQIRIVSDKFNLKVIGLK